ncbi:hypothetical protein HBB16_17210 [Pseudonocardia sp. MCCB 268]|nr:hypothetical protein [Pseudonocardia cytotoxica]
MLSIPFVVVCLTLAMRHAEPGARRRHQQRLRPAVRARLRQRARQVRRLAGTGGRAEAVPTERVVPV